MKYGYARVSTEDQTHAMQLDALNAAGCGRIFIETMSGAKKHQKRPELARLLETMKAGDEIVVWKLDRLGRSVVDLHEIASKIEKAGAAFSVVTQPIDTKTPAGRLFFNMLASIAEFERDLIAERTKEGLAAKKRRGEKLGRKTTLTREICMEAKNALKYDTWKGVAATFGVTPSALSHAFKRYGITQEDADSFVLASLTQPRPNQCTAPDVEIADDFARIVEAEIALAPPTPSADRAALLAG